VQLREAAASPGEENVFATQEELRRLRKKVERLRRERDIWLFMRERKKFWLAPIIIVMVLSGALIVLTQGSAVAPFIYTLF
jgi:hypothetical protein